MMDTAALNKIQERLTLQAYDSFSKEDWKVVILGFIRSARAFAKRMDDEEEDDQAVLRLPRLSFHAIVGGQSGWAKQGFLGILSEDLSVYARMLFSEGFAELVQEECERHLSGAATSAIVMDYLRTYLDTFDGAIPADMAQKLIVNEQLPIQLRTTLARVTAHQGFRNALPFSFWLMLERRLDQEPDFLQALLVYHEASRGTDYVATLLKKATRSPSEPGLLMLALDEFISARVLRHGAGRARIELAEFPTWIKDLALEHVPSAKKLFEAAAP